MPTSRGTVPSSHACGSSSGSGCWRRCPSSMGNHRPRRLPGRSGDHERPLGAGSSHSARALAGGDARRRVGPGAADRGAREALPRGARDRRTQSRAVAKPLAGGARTRARELPSLEVHVARGARAPQGTVPRPGAAPGPRAPTMRGLAAALLTLGALTGCGARAFAGAAPPVGTAPAEATRPVPPLGDDRRILHVLNRLAFGPRPGDVARVRAVGLDAWIDRQLRPETIDDSATERALVDLASLRMSISEALREYPRPDPKLREKLQNGRMTRTEMMETYPPEKRPFRIAAELQAAKTLRAVKSERQLAEVMVDFWFNHFNVFAGKGDVRWYVSAYERDVIRPNALGRFPDLVRASARHPAMLFYLDNWLSARPDFIVPSGQNRGRKAGLNENYARELMELHTLGVDGGYTQTDVTEVARAFTGWSIDRPRVEGRYVFRPRMHDTAAKVVLGHRLPAGGGRDDGERVLAILTRHPSTARL